MSTLYSGPKEWRIRGILISSISPVFLVIAIGCGSSAADSAQYKRVQPMDVVLEISDSEAAGIKTVRQYDVTNLPSAVDAWFGFRRGGGGLVPLDYEMRFYPDHATAVADGDFYADDVTGEGANILSTDAAWLEWSDDRPKWWGGNTAAFVLLPNYNDYIVYGNVIVLCQGRSAEISQNACNWLIDRLEANIAS